MSTAGPNFAGAGANDSSFGSSAWSNPGNITSANGTASTTFLSGAGTTSQYLVSSSHGFSIPSGATINGITVEWQKQYTNIGGSAQDTRVRIVKGGVIDSTDKAATGVDWSSSGYVFVTYGGSSDLWGLSWTDTDINSSGFGSAIAAISSGGSCVAGVDSCRITIDYTAAATGQPAVKRMGGIGFAHGGHQYGSGIMRWRREDSGLMLRNRSIVQPESLLAG